MNSNIIKVSRVVISLVFALVLSACGPGGSGNGAVSSSPPATSDKNSAPVAFADIASGSPATALKVDVLANDMDPDGDSLSLLSVDAPVGGIVTIDDNGTPTLKSDDTISYMPDPGFVGTAAFSYTVSDGKNGTASAKITLAIGVNLVKNGSPVAANDSISTAMDSPVMVPVLDNDIDSDGGMVVITGVTSPAHGTVSIDDNGTPADSNDDRVNYSPALGYSGPDSFVYTITDGTTAVSAAVTVDVTPLVPPSGASTQSVISGRVVKGPLAGAIIELYELDAFGFPVTSIPVAQTVSDIKGYWHTVVPLPRTNLLVVSRGGAYINEARSGDVAVNRYTFFNAVDRLETAMPSTENFAVISVFTNALLLRARYGATSGGFQTKFESALADATAALGFNPLGNDPTNPADPSYTASPQSRWHALALGGVSNVINRVSQFYFRTLPDYEMVDAVIRDLADCRLDGRGFSGAIGFTLNGVPVAMPTGIKLNTEIIRFHNNNSERFTTTPIKTVQNALCAAPPAPVDLTPPSISLLGSNPLNVLLGTLFSDPGAIATDNLDGDISASILHGGTVDTTVAGVYTVLYDVSDAAGNPAVQATRTVIVNSSGVPEITLLGSNFVSHEAATSYIDTGATASDPEDGDLSASITVTGAVDVNVPGSYILSYNVTDSDGDAALPITRTISVVDTTSPVVTLIGSPVVSVEAIAAYGEPGFSANDSLDGDITGDVVVTGAVNTLVVGDYVLTYNVNDAAGNASTAITRTVQVRDTIAPVITLTGTNPQTIQAGSAYTELNATASDNLDGDISASIGIDASAVNTAALGSYVVTYNVTDSEGNVATTVNRIVDVVDTTPPVITILGNNPESVAEDTVYADAGATANDNLDGDLTPEIATVSTVNTSLPGTYEVTYDVADAATNNAIQATRSVTVTPVNDAPVLDFPVPDDSATETVAYSTDLSLYFSDEENDVLNYTVTGLPFGTGLALDSATGILSGAPNATDAAASPVNLTIIAEDPSLDSAQDTFVLTIVQVVDLELLMIVDDSTPNEGQAIVYTVSLSNAGPSAATNIDIQNLQPAGVTFGTATPSAGSFVGNIWSLPGLANGASATLVINATVDAGTGGSGIVNVVELIAVDQMEVDVAESSSATINVPTGTAVLKTWVGGASGPPGSETDWNRNANWSPTGTPTTNDDIEISNTVFDPVLDADLTVSSLRVAFGGNFDIGPHTLTVTGEVRGDSAITGTGLVVVTAGTVRGGLPSLRIDGDVKVQNNLTVNGDLTILGTLNAATSVVVNGDLNVTGGTGILIMQVGASFMIVNGDVLFNGGDHSVFVGDKAPLHRGDMWVTGDFTQSGNPFSFVGENAHRVILGGTIDQTITMMNPDNSNPNPATPPATGSRFANLYLAKDQGTDGNVILATDIAVLIQVQSSGAYDPRIVSSTGRRMIAGGASFVLGTFDNVPIEFVDGDDFDNFRFVTFENMANDVVQVRLLRTETFGSVYHFDNLGFMSMPNTTMGGYYIEGANLGGAPITLNIWSSFPGTGEADSNTIGNFTLNW